MSSLGNASTFGLGFAEAADIAAGGTFAGQTVDGTAVVVKFTHYGDATLDGRVDFNDLVRLAQNFGTTPPATQGAWSRGDFTYDGIINFSDLVTLAQNFNAGVAGSASLSKVAQASPMAAVEAEHLVGGSLLRRATQVEARPSLNSKFRRRCGWGNWGTRIRT